jgi:hypothetical protein
LAKSILGSGPEKNGQVSKFSGTAVIEKERKRFGAQRATRGVAATEKDSIAKVETGEW